jgi:presenilin-like A22 family membrane protease
MFLLTSILAIISAFKLNELVKAEKIYLPKISLQDFLFSFLFILFFILLFVYYKKAHKFKELIYKVLFMVTVFWGGMTIFNLWLPIFGSVLIMGFLIILWLKNPFVFVHDVLIGLGLAGVASFFGLGFNPAVVIVLLVIFSFYDFIAVYKTKHMVKMAKDMIEKKVILGFVIPKEIQYFKDKLSDVKLKPSSKEASSGLGNFLILGGGDVVFPGLLAVSVVPSGFFKALLIVIFSLFGSLFSYWLFASQKHREPIPALPPIALFSIIGYIIGLLL